MGVSRAGFGVRASCFRMLQGGVEWLADTKSKSLESEGFWLSRRGGDQQIPRRFALRNDKSCAGPIFGMVLEMLLGQGSRSVGAKSVSEGIS